MKRMLCTGLVVVLFCGLGGCKSKHEAVADDMTAVMSEMCDILDGVTDQASAEAAVPKIEQLGTRMKDIVERAKALGTPPKEEQERIQKKMTDQQQKLQARMQANGQKMAQYPVLMQAFMKMMTGGMQMPMPVNMGGNQGMPTRGRGQGR